MLQFGSSIHSLTNMNMERRELQSKKREDLGKFKRKLHVITFYETAIGLNIGGSSLDDVRLNAFFFYFYALFLSQMVL